jgi:hypothetical protein
VETITENLQLTRNSEANKHQNLSAQKDCIYMQNCHFLYAVISFTSVFQEHGFSSRSLDIREPSSYIDTLLVLVERGYQTVPVRQRSTRTNYICNTIVYQCHVQQSQIDLHAERLRVVHDQQEICSDFATLLKSKELQVVFSLQQMEISRHSKLFQVLRASEVYNYAWIHTSACFIANAPQHIIFLKTGQKR